jgi:hypothetical protein
MAPSIKKKGPVRADATSMSTHAKSRAKTRMTDSAVGDSDNPRENKNRRSRGRWGRAGIDSDDESMKDGTNQGKRLHGPFCSVSWAMLKFSCVTRENL